VAEPLPPIGFWSYTSLDDRHSNGRLSALRLQLAGELQVLVGRRPVRVFQDKDMIPFGADWAQKIEEALGQSSFLIPIVTPGFLQSEWCCKEVTRFREREQALGRNDLIFPFLFVGVADVDPNDPDECVNPAVFRLLKSRQWFDFTSLRFHEPADREVAKQLAALAGSVRTALRGNPARHAGGADIVPRTQPTQASPTPLTRTTGAASGVLPAKSASGASEAHVGPTGPPLYPSPVVLQQRSRSTPLIRWRDSIPGLPADACPEMITLPAGRFIMGASETDAQIDDDERPRREVGVPSFALGRGAVTFAQWDAARAAGADLANPRDEGWGRGERPVINVSWYDAQAYCAWLNERLFLTSSGYRLPSEAEWEFACRAGTRSPFHFGATVSTNQANYNGNFTYGDGHVGRYRGRTVPVGDLPANAWGFHEMHGNVWEWCEDVYGPYPAHPTDAEPLRHGKETKRVLRGGSWCDYPRHLRAAYRSRNMAAYSASTVGFRVARTLST